jgi:GNAT superfamily N-acetyltransferase
MYNLSIIKQMKDLIILKGGYIMNLVIKSFDVEEIQCHLSSLIEIEDLAGRWAYEGFTYFKSANVSSNLWITHRIFVAFDSDNKIVGVLKFSPFQRFSKCGNVWIVNWVDVHRDYRKKGIATDLYQALNSWVSSDMIIVGDHFSEEGLNANLASLRTKIIINCLVFPERLDFEEYLEMKKIA